MQTHYTKKNEKGHQKNFSMEVEKQEHTKGKLISTNFQITVEEIRKS